MVSHAVETAWHALEAAEVARRLSPSSAGLNDAALGRRRAEFGPNTIPLPKAPSALRLILRQFQTPLMYIVLGAVAISVWLGHLTDAVFIVFVIAVNTFLGFLQERKAGQTAAALKRFVKDEARVRRNGFEQVIAADDVVPGDRLLIRAGDRITADARLVENQGLTVDESTLTGEWLPILKVAETLPATTPMADRKNMVWAGTLALEGSGEAVVTRTGAATEFGRIVELLRETPHARTPLQKRLGSLSIILGAGIVSFAVVVVGIGIAAGQRFDEIFVAALALVVSAIPEGLLPLITVVLALGMRRVLKVRGLVRNLAATETLGAITVICTDKTGTLTEGQMQVSRILTTTRELAHGPPYERFDHNGLESHIVALKIAVLVSDAFIENPKDSFADWVIRGRPTERALVLAGMHSGLEKQELEEKYPRLDHLSFESGRGYAVSLRQDGSRVLFAVVGEPERIIRDAHQAHSDGHITPFTAQRRAAALEHVAALAGQGLRVLACAAKHFPRRPENQNLEELFSELTFVGLIALVDPLRPEAAGAIAIAKRAGIRPVMVTGDHPATALAVASKVGLGRHGRAIAVTGRELEEMTPAAFAAAVGSHDVFARVSPQIKVRIVEALQQAGAVVAMTGDGVNDAPALRRADVGLALGSGTEVAKEAADIVLLDDNFKIITDAIEEGRTLFGTIRKLIVYLLTDDFSELILFLGAMSLGMPIPLLPAQILWINVIEDGFPGTALAFERKEHEVMADPPRDPREPLFNAPLRRFALAVAAITGIAALGAFTLLWARVGELEKVRTMVFVLMALDSLIFAFVMRRLRRPVFRRDLFSNRLLVAAALFGLAMLALAVYFPPLQAVVSTVALSPWEWGIIILVSLTELAFLEIAKARCFGRTPKS